MLGVDEFYLLLATGLKAIHKSVVVGWWVLNIGCWWILFMIYWGL